MPNVPLRSLGEVGILPDLSSFDVPITGWSWGANIRYEDSKIARGPITMTPQVMSKPPQWLFNWIDPLSTLVQGAVVTYDGFVYKWIYNNSGTAVMTNLTPVAWVAANGELPVTTTEVNGVVYVNRPDHIPWKFIKATDTAFAEIPNGGTNWPTTLRADALRSVRGMLIGINLTQGSNENPTSVIWSDFTLYNTVPPNWDYAGTTSSAGINTLSDLESPLIDGCPLRGDMVLYASDETWIMRYVGGNDIWNFDRIFSPQGIISQNCAVELNGTHFVFGPTDIWVHDGVRPQSISEKKVRKTIFKSMIRSQAHFCFTFHNVRNNEIWFCFPAQHANARWQASNTTRGCTLAAAFNVENNTWAFYDLPYVMSATEALSSVSVVWDATSPTLWDDSSGGWDSGTDGAITANFIGMIVNASVPTVNSVAIFATPQDPGISGTVDTNLTSPVTLIKYNMDLDELQKPLRGYALCSSLYPQINTVYAGDFTFQMGTSDHPSIAPAWGNLQNFNLTTYKMDHNIAGRYLSLRVTSPISEAFDFTGVDLDVTQLGMR